MRDEFGNYVIRVRMDFVETYSKLFIEIQQGKLIFLDIDYKKLR